MGMFMSKAREGLAGNAVQVEQLDFIHRMAKSKLDTYEANLNSMFRDPSSSNKVQIVGKRAMRYEKRYAVDVKDIYIDEAIGDGIDCFFPTAAAESSWNYFDETDAPISEDRVDKDGFIMDPRSPGTRKFPEQKAKRVSVYDDYTLEGLKTLIAAAFKVILNNRAEGEHEDRKFFVIIQNNVICRIDVCMWRYNFTDATVMAGRESILGYLFCLSVVDHTCVSLDEMMYLISETVGGDLDSVQPYVERLLEVWELMGNMQATASKYRHEAGTYNGAPGGSVMNGFQGAFHDDDGERSVRGSVRASMMRNAAMPLPAPSHAAMAIPRSAMMTPTAMMLPPARVEQPIYIGNARMFQ